MHCVAMEDSSLYTFFFREWEEHGELCQWYPSSMSVLKSDLYNAVGKEVGNAVSDEYITFVCAEQLMMYCKGIAFDDMQTAEAIMRTDSPREHKALGRKTSGFDITKWRTVMQTVVYLGSISKFSQNPSLRAKLMSTGTTTLVEASPWDRVWGVGYYRTNAVHHLSDWGENLLGITLMKVRQRLKEMSSVIETTKYSGNMVRYQPDLRHMSVSDCCAMLLHRLDPSLSISTSYAAAYANYVMTWEYAVPLKAIVLAQSPYPNEIYPHTAAAMSYDQELCTRIMRSACPPTVSVLANDLLINAGVDYETTAREVRDGWRMVYDGVILVNETVHTKYGTVQSFDEGVDQCNTIVRMLQDTEKYGKSNVDVFALGTAGKKMASNITSWFKSPIVKLTTRSVDHPASLSYKFTDLRNPKCHMGVPSFSKALAKHICNEVAIRHSMAPKRSESELRAQTLYDLTNRLVSKFPAHRESIDQTVECLIKFDEMALDKDEEYAAARKQLIESLQNLSVKTGVLAAMAQAASSNYKSVGGAMGKAAPALSSVDPSPDAMNRHQGKGVVSMPTKTIVSTPVSIGGSSTPVSIRPSARSASVMKSTPVSIGKSIHATPVLIKSSKAKPDTAASSTAGSRASSVAPSGSRLQSSISVNVSSQAPSDTGTIAGDTPTQATVTPTQKRYQKITAVTIGKKPASPPTVDPYIISPEVVSQLSAVEAVVEAGMAGIGKDLNDDNDTVEMLENIQHDIAKRRRYNDVVNQLVPCIEADLKNIPNFSLVSWAIGNKDHSDTYEKCKQLFEF